MSKCVLICIADPACTLAEAISARFSEAGYEVVCTTRPGEAPALLFLKDAGAAVVVLSPEDPATSELADKLRCVRANIPVFAVSSAAGDLVTQAPDGSAMPTLLPALEAMAATQIARS